MEQVNASMRGHGPAFVSRAGDGDGERDGDEIAGDDGEDESSRFAAGPDPPSDEVHAVTITLTATAAAARHR